ncbi:MAG: ABC transporter substrate-binding protein [Prochlorothrix sp.]|nr:ABC transporter substrate-binding protein [Prochlorothrix sp.]
MMYRRRFLNLALSSSLATSAIACGKTPAPAPSPSPSSSLSLDRPQVNWRMATSWPRSATLLGTQVEQLCQRVSYLTGGAFTLTPYKAGELEGANDPLAAVVSGNIECAHASSLTVLQQQPALVFSHTVPFGLTTQQQNAWLYYGGGLEWMQELYQALGVMAFPAGNLGPGMGGWFKQDITGVADLAGLAFAIEGLGGEVMAELGAKPQALDPGAIVAALNQGSLAGVAGANPHDDEQAGLHRAVSFYYAPRWWAPAETLALMINGEKWASLPLDYQRSLQLAAAEANQVLPARYRVANGQALERLQRQAVQIKPYPTPILDAAYAATEAVLDRQSQQNAKFRAVYTRWLEFRQQVYQWHQFNELGFAQFVLAR